MVHMFASLKRALATQTSPKRDASSGRDRIITVLQALKEDHQLLSVSVAGCRASATSVILGVHESRNCFLLDELSVPDAHRAFLQRRKALIETRVQGIELRFTCRLLTAGTASGIALYQVAIPTQMKRVQRRAHFRLCLAPGLAVPVSIPRPEGGQLSGEAFDLSASGIGLFLRTRNIPDRGRVLRDLSIALPGTRPLVTDIEVRFATLNSPQHMLRLGARFVGLDRQRERKLALFLAEQQRKRRRFEQR